MIYELLYMNTVLAFLMGILGEKAGCCSSGVRLVDYCIQIHANPWFYESPMDMARTPTQSGRNAFFMAHEFSSNRPITLNIQKK